ncbi:MAG: nickel-responsive transcriptional regulator NikR [Myxococcales bacterium]|nr:nickel-responsive transcriptional regulator NikR [Myxococcales bacterium]
MPGLSRFGVAMETSLLAQFDQIVRERKSTRSEVLRDLARAEIVRSLAAQRVEAFASVTIVYNHHVRELSERITEMQHELGDQVRSTMHVHLDHDRCLEVIVMRGRADRLQRVAETLFATRGVLQGSIEIVADPAVGAVQPQPGEAAHAAHDHHHEHPHAGHPPPRGRSRRR